MCSHLPHPTQDQHLTQDQRPTQVEIRHEKIWELAKATPLMDIAKASSIGSEPDLLRLESLRMEETAPAASSTLRSKDSPSRPVSEPFLFNSSNVKEGGLTLYVGGFQTVMGMTVNGCSTALTEELFAFASDLEWDYELEALGTSTEGGHIFPSIRTRVEGEEEDAPNF